MQDNLSGIYCIENLVNHRKYIGMSRDIKRRWIEHRTELNHNQHDNQYLQSSWNKYGKDNFKFYIIEKCPEDILSEREIHYIKQYNSLSHQEGYNLTPGGENTSIGKLVISLKDGKIYTFVKDAANHEGITPITMIEWCRQKHNYMYLDEYNSLSDEEKEYWKNYDWEKAIHEKLSKAHSRENISKETLKKLSEATSGSNNPRSMKVYCPQLDETFDCMTYATEKYGINKGSISSCIKGKLKSAGKHPITGERLTWELIEK